jgi:aspartyl-tRNA(Asn)/glutamyl-tRNA(Gln) amidotransferase subunit A
MEQARRAERELAAGRDFGPLHGIPYGARTCSRRREASRPPGARHARKDQRFDEDATVIRKLEAAGRGPLRQAGWWSWRAAGPPLNLASFTGPGINPWNLDAWSGGSSGGSRLGRLGGLVPFAIGSETWGSILGPAGY